MLICELLDSRWSLFISCSIESFFILLSSVLLRFLRGFEILFDLTLIFKIEFLCLGVAVGTEDPSSESENTATLGGNSLVCVLPLVFMCSEFCTGLWMVSGDRLKSLGFGFENLSNPNSLRDFEFRRTSALEKLLQVEEGLVSGVNLEELIILTPIVCIGLALSCGTWELGIIMFWTIGGFKTSGVCVICLISNDDVGSKYW